MWKYYLIFLSCNSLVYFFFVWEVLYETSRYSCLFVTKLSSKKILFLKKYFCFLLNIYYYRKKYFYMENYFTEKNLFYREKYKWKYKKYFSFQKHIFTQKVFVLQIKYKSFLNIYSFHKNKIFLIIKNIFVKTTLWTQ